MDDYTIKPFLKWAGGKSQLLSKITEFYPFNDKYTKYVEPFVGGGTVLFDIIKKYDLDSICICDKNKQLIDTYKTIKNSPFDIIKSLNKVKEDYAKSKDKENFYFNVRTRYNELVKNKSKDRVSVSALLIFLNKTCFNGLFRVNGEGEFNVPYGKNKRASIFDEKNIINVSKALQKVKILNRDYSRTLQYIDCKTFVYLDPPYRPITNNSSKRIYTQEFFGDQQQIKLSEFIREIDKCGAKFLLSNSDPKNLDKNDLFFDNLYSNYKISRVSAKRMINCKGESRGNVKELLVCN